MCKDFVGKIDWWNEDRTGVKFFEPTPYPSIPRMAKTRLKNEMLNAFSMANQFSMLVITIWLENETLSPEEFLDLTCVGTVSK